MSILNDIVHPVENVRLAASEALANVIKENHLDMASNVLQSLQSTYEDKNIIIPPKLDQFGRPINNQQSIDEWESRASIGLLKNIFNTVNFRENSPEFCFLRIFSGKLAFYCR